MRGLLGRRRAAPAPPPEPAPLRRSVAPAHHRLTLAVARSGVPVPGARVALRPHAGDGRLLDTLARTTTGRDGSATLLLPAGRYAVSVGHAGDAKCVSVTVDRDGRVTVALEPTGRRVVLTVETGLPRDAPVEARFPDGALAARTFTDERGVAALLVPPGEVDVDAGGRRLRTRVEADSSISLRS